MTIVAINCCSLSVSVIEQFSDELNVLKSKAPTMRDENNCTYQIFASIMFNSNICRSMPAMLCMPGMCDFLYPGYNYESIESR